jgi:AraC family transcriptional regulator, alkane utilization regulator
MDVLSEVLRVVRLSGVIHFNAEFSEPWAFISSAPDVLRTRMGAESVTPFHVFVGGHCFVRLENHPPIRIETGDVIVMPRGDQHVMASDLSLSPVPSKNIYPVPSRERIMPVQHGGGGSIARFICGFLHSDQRFDPLLNSLPPALCVRTRIDGLTLETLGPHGWSKQRLSNEHEAGLWQASLQYLIRETAEPGPGNRAVLARLSEFLFMEVLRWQLRSAAEGNFGWLAGLHDPHVGRALQLMHADPARAWTVEGLAEQAALSRAALAKKFGELVGQAPMHYLAAWRMHLARSLLRDSKLSIGEIAERVGYESEAAFNRAFSRDVGAPPASWRRTNMQAEGAQS